MQVNSGKRGRCGYITGMSRCEFSTPFTIASSAKSVCFVSMWHVRSLAHYKRSENSKQEILSMFAKRRSQTWVYLMQYESVQVIRQTPAGCATEALQSHLCSTYSGLWGGGEAGGCRVVVAQWQSTGCTSQVSWIQFPATAGLFAFLYFRLITSKYSLYFYFNMRQEF